MATNDNDIPGDIRIVKEFGRFHLELFNKYSPEKLEDLIEDAATGAIQSSTIVENAISFLGKIKKDATRGRDFEDGTDAKKASIAKDDPQNRTNVRNIKNKNGGLRIVIDTNEITNCAVPFVYVAIPYDAYQHLLSSDCLKIPVNCQGKVTGKYAIWQVSSIEDLATIKFRPNATSLRYEVTEHASLFEFNEVLYLRSLIRILEEEKRQTIRKQVIITELKIVENLFIW